MDTALALKIAIDKGQAVSPGDAVQHLENSALVRRLTQDWHDEPLFYVWRLIALSEIPFAGELDYTRKLIDRIHATMATPFGFSLSGDASYFLPCYNAMLVSAFCRLGLARSAAVLNAVDWIVTHQPMDRGVSVSVPGFRFDRFGGCFRDTPCYIGLAKSVLALQAYWQRSRDSNVADKLAQGKAYLLKHQLVKRLSEDKPITQHILDISFPESYHLNIVELIRFARDANLLNDPRTDFVRQYLRDNREESGWKINYRYRSKGYITFDRGSQPGAWVTYIIDRALAQTTASALPR